MKYLSLSEFSTNYPQFNFPISLEQETEFAQFVSNHTPWERFGLIDKQRFIESCKDHKSIVFFSWIEINKNLNKALLSGLISEKYAETNQISKHALFQEFRGFISPMIVNILVDFFKKENYSRSIGLSWLPLIDDQYQDVIQEKEFKKISAEKSKGISEITKAKSDQSLFTIFCKTFDLAFFQEINTFSNSFYKVKTHWVEYFLSLAQHKYASERLILELIKNGRKINLKDHHLKQLDQLESDVKAKKFQFESKQYPWVRISTTIIGACLLVAAIIFIFSARSDQYQAKTQEATSFMKLSQQERDKIAGLLKKEKERRRVEYVEKIDSQIPFIGEDLVQAQTWYNETFSAMHEAWRLNDSAVLSSVFSGKKTVFPLYPKNKELKNRSGQKTSEFSNETQQNCLVILFQDSKGSPVYSHYLAPKESMKFELKLNDILIVLPGGNVSKNMSFKSMPFQQVNEQFYENLGSIYEVRNLQSKEIKFVWEDIGNQSYFLVDLFGALEKI